MSDPIQLVRPEPNERLVAELEFLLDKAKAGEIVGLVWAKFTPDRQFGTGHAGQVSHLEVAGGLFYALHDLVDAHPIVQIEAPK